MDALSPLLFLLLSLVLFIGTGESAASHGTTPSSVFAYVVATLLAVVGGGTLLYRRMQEGDAGGGVRKTWAEVLRDAVGAGVAGAGVDLVRDGLWGVLLACTVVATVFVISTFPSASPLAWIGYAVLAAMFIATIATAPVIADIKGTGRLGQAFKGLSSLFGTSRVVGLLVVAAVLISTITLGAVYPPVGWGVLAALVIGAVYYSYQNADDWMPIVTGLFQEVGEAFGLAAPAQAGPQGADRRHEDIEREKAEVAKLAGAVSERRMVLGTLVVCGLVVALAVYMPYIWRQVPSLRIRGQLGTSLLDGPVALSTWKSMPVPGGFGKGTVTDSQGTSNYTVAWWQFVNARAHDRPVPILELGPAGQVLLGPGPKAATVALNTAAPAGAVEQVKLKLTPQRWQHVALRASGNRTDVFLDGKLVGSSLRAPVPLRADDMLNLPGTPPRETQGGIARLTYSGRAEPFSALVLAANTPPPTE